MKSLRKYIPKSLKHYCRAFISNLWNLPYNRYGLPVEIAEWLPLKSKITVIDIGASEGNFFLRLDQSYQVEQALLIEPLPNRVKELEEKYHKNPNYKIIERALSDVEGESEFHIATEFDYVSSLLELESAELSNLQIEKPKTIRIKTQTLDALYLESGLKIIDFIKMDVQGVEYLVLKSGIQTLMHTKMVYIEVSYKKLYVNAATFFDIYRFFEENNFRLVNINQGYKLPNGELLQSDALFVNNNFL